MRGQADPVPGPVAEMLAVPGSLDHLSCQPVDTTPGQRLASPDRSLQLRNGRCLASLDELVDLEIARRRLADEEGTGHVASVAVNLRTEIEEQDLSSLDRPIARRAVRQCGLRSCERRDVECQCLSAPRSHVPFELECELMLRPADPDRGKEGRQRTIGHRARSGDPLQLGRFLGRPVLLDPALDGNELDRRSGRAQPPPQGVAHESRLDSNPPRSKR